MQGGRRILITGAVVLVAVIAGLKIISFSHNANTLWNIVSQQCVPNQQQNNDPAPCRMVDLRNGYVVMKDREGPLQFLLIPVKKLAGIESPELLNPSAPNYFAEAWHARHFMEERRGSPVEDRAVALSINSQRGRTQNQLHIHISCLRPDIRRQLDRLNDTLSEKWQSTQLGEHIYQVRLLSREELKKTSPILRVANELPGAREEMGKYGIAVAAMPGGRRVLMVIKRNMLLLNRGSAEELQDHSCSLLQPSS